MTGVGGEAACVRVVVDAANVVGARPDAWWRDRAGAAGRLTERIRAALRDDPAALAAGLGHPGADPDVIVVLEGAARAGAAAGHAIDVPLRVVHAAAGGDDEIVRVTARAEPPVVVVTADRGLRERVRSVGARTVGPQALLHALPGT